MADPKPRPALRIETLASTLEQKLEDEAAILDVLVAALARGQGNEALWEQLHAAAARDDRTAELAFSYERLARDKKIKSLTAAAQATVLAHAGVFSADVFGDADGAEGYLERALSLAPGDVQAFDEYEKILAQRHDLRRLGELYAAAAPHRGDKAEQLRMLRRGAELVEGDPERALKLNLEIVKLDPADANARKAIVAAYEKTGRLADLAKMLEQLVTQDPPPDAEESLAIRLRLLSLYAGGLGEIERAMPHVEEVLRADPLHAEARRVATELVGHKSLTARAAGALSDAYEAAGEPSDAAEMRAAEIEALRGPKRLEAQKKLSRMTLEQLGDLEKTFVLDEAIVVLDPADDEVRARFVQLASALDKQAEATRTLGRAATASKDVGVRARIGADLGDLYRELGDVKKARASYQGVIDAPDADASLRAARALAALNAEPRDSARARGGARAPVADRAGGERAARRDGGPRGRGRAGARTTCRWPSRRTSGSWARPATPTRAPRSAGSTRRRAPSRRSRRSSIGWRAPSATRGRRRTWRSARRTSIRASCPTRARRWPHGRCSWRRTGPRARRSPGSCRSWSTRSAGTSSRRRCRARRPQPPRPSRRASSRASGSSGYARLNDARGALDAFKQALALDPAEKQARQALDKMLASGDLRLAAADVLEPIARKEGAAPVLLRVLETRASLSEDPRARLAALEEATERAAGPLKIRSARWISRRAG